MPLWWNWQTRGTQNPVVAIPCRFDPDQRHHLSDDALGKGLSRSEIYLIPNFLKTNVQFLNFNLIINEVLQIVKQNVQKFNKNFRGLIYVRKKNKGNSQK